MVYWPDPLRCTTPRFASVSSSSAVIDRVRRAGLREFTRVLRDPMCR